MKLVIEVKRRRMSVTQGVADVYVNGQKVITFGDEIEMIKEGERCYGDNIGGWGIRMMNSTILGRSWSGFWWMERIWRLQERIRRRRDEKQKVLARTD